MHILPINSSVRARVSHIDLQDREAYALIVLTGKGYDHMDATMQRRWMTLREVAEYLQLSKDMIYRLAQCGKDSGIQGRESMAISDKSGSTAGWTIWLPTLMHWTASDNVQE